MGVKDTAFDSFMPVIVVLLLLLLPVIAPVAVLLNAVDNRRRRIVAASFACMKCGALLETRSLKIADDEWRAHVRELHNHFRGRGRLHRTCDAICSKCGTRHQYSAKRRTFEFEKSRGYVPTNCPTCGYDTRAQAGGGHCSECGTVVSQYAPADGESREPRR